MRYVSGLVRAALFVMVLSIAPCVAGAASSSDAALAKDVERQLMDNKSFDATGVTVTSEDGVIHLIGSMKNRGEAAKMVHDTMYMPGVKNVRTQLDIASDNK